MSRKSSSDCFVSKDGGETWETFNRKYKRSDVSKRNFITIGANAKATVTVRAGLK